MNSLNQLTARGKDSPWYKGWDLTEGERAAFRATTLASQHAKRIAISGECEMPKHPINVPRLDPLNLMPQREQNQLSALSLFSGGGGMDIGFDRAGFSHVASYELMPGAANVLQAARPSWKIFGGADGDVKRIDWSGYRGKIDVLHGGPPCQPFSHAGRQNGAADIRDMIPEMVRAVKAIRPRVFVCENVSGLITKRFEPYVKQTIYEPLQSDYVIRQFCLDAADFGVPQRRRRVIFVGFASEEEANRFKAPEPTHLHEQSKEQPISLPRAMGVREALGLVDIGYDGLAPTLRSGLTGPRHTTSILSSVTASKLWSKLEVWPNGVGATREAASAYVAKNGHFRLSVPDCLVLQGFPSDWPVGKPVYFALGLIGNSVAPPMAYHLAAAISEALN